MSKPETFEPIRLFAFYPWSTICRRSMLPVVNCAGCQLGLHRPPQP